MEVQIKYMGYEVTAFEELLASFPLDEFDSPFCSTVLHLAYWSDVEHRMKTLQNVLGFQRPESLTATFEFQVYPPIGQGKPSQTDLMITWRGCCIAIEAKYTEDSYASIKTWLMSVNPLNARKVLRGWCKLIEGTTGFPLVLDDLGDLTYQVLHRVASACVPIAEEHHVIYQGFELSEKKANYYKGELQKLYHHIRCPSNLKFIVLNIPIKPSEPYLQLQMRWNNGERHLRREVLECLHSEGFVEFGKPVIFEVN
jgi:uncharacterized protein DUF6946